MTRAEVARRGGRNLQSKTRECPGAANLLFVDSLIARPELVIRHMHGTTRSVRAEMPPVSQPERPGAMAGRGTRWNADDHE